jgi:hypothetical protein
MKNNPDWLEVLMVNNIETTSGSNFKVTVTNIGPWGSFKWEFKYDTFIFLATAIIYIAFALCLIYLIYFEIKIRVTK